jgi:hypothetical protein
VRYARNKRQIDHGRQPALSKSNGPAHRVLEDPPPYATPATPRKLLDRVRWHLRVKRYSIRTELAYVDWIRRFTPGDNLFGDEALCLCVALVE